MRRDRALAHPAEVPTRNYATQLGVRVLLLAAAAASGACRSADDFRDEADAEVYSILDARRNELGFAEEFDIAMPENDLRARLVAGVEPLEDGQLVVDLVESLQIAAENSREYQTEKEALYRAALALTLERYDYRLQRFGSLGGAVDFEGENPEEARFDGNLNLRKLLGSGALIIANIGFDLFRNLTFSDDWDLTSRIDLSITQPLLRGFGSTIVKEPLTQAERDVVYAVRSYERFRRTFAFDVAEFFYRTLEQLNTLANEEANYASLTDFRLRNEALAEAGRTSEIQVDQARQDELSARDRVVAARRDLQNRLDAFKLFLGLPVDIALAVDPAEQERLDAFLASGVDVDEETAVRVALRDRLDFQTVQDRVIDAERRVVVAADALRMGLDLVVDGQAVSDPDQPWKYSSSDIDWSVGFLVDLPIDRIPERNTYRARLIDLELARRNEEQEGDRIRAELRAELRELDTAERSYTIQDASVQLAGRRVESTRLNLDAGRASTRDLLESQNALVEAQNASTRALIDFALAGLAFYRDVELLRIDDSGLSVDLDPLEFDAAMTPEEGP